MTSEQMVQHIVSKVIPTMQIDLHRGRHELPDGSHYNVDEYISKPPQAFLRHYRKNRLNII